MRWSSLPHHGGSTPANRRWLRRVVCSTALLVAVAGIVSQRLAISADLEAPVRASLQQLPLGQLVERLGSMTGTPVVLDRRIAPTQPASLQARGESLRDVLLQIAADHGADLADLTATVWLVPPGEAGQLEQADRLRQHALARLPAVTRASLNRTAAWEWSAGTTPATLLTTLLETATPQRLVIDWDEQPALPHDHLPAGSLPPLSLAERFDLIAMRYGMRVNWTQAGPSQHLCGRLVPLPAGSPETAPRPAPPQPARRPRRSTPPGTARFSLRVAAPLDELLAAVAAQCELTLVLDAAALRDKGLDPKTIIRLEVRDVDRAGLLTAITDPLNLSWSIAEGTLRIPAAAAAGELSP